jgi:hypothetical protein
VDEVRREETGDTEVGERIEETTTDRVMVDNLNVRSVPSVLYGQIMAQLNTGHAVEVISRTRWRETISGATTHWLEVKYGGESPGWVFGAFVAHEPWHAIPIHNGGFHIAPGNVSQRLDALIPDEAMEPPVLPVAVNPSSRIPAFGYALYRGVYLWMDNESKLNAFDGTTISEVINLDLFDTIGLPIGDAFPIVEEDSIYVFGVGSRLFDSFLMPGYVVELKSGQVTLDESGERFRDIFARSEALVPWRDGYFHAQEGYRFFHDGNIYGVFVFPDDQRSVVASDGTAHRVVSELPSEFRLHFPRFVEYPSVVLFKPRDGWRDEETTGPYEVVEWNYESHQVTRRYTATEEELRSIR